MAESWTVQNQPTNACMVGDDKHERRRRQLRKLKTCCQSFWSFLFSHIGLSAVVVAYSIMGGFLFQWLEAPNESLVKANMEDRKNATVIEIIQQAQEFENDSDILRDKVFILIAKFEDELIQAVKDNGYDGKKTDELKWTYAGALLFAVTVITTIGYGHVAPKTPEGRLITILYALIGIPLTFLCLANIGDFLANCFRWFYAKVCCGICCVLFSKSSNKKKNAGSKRPRSKSLNHEPNLDSSSKQSNSSKKERKKRDKKFRTDYSNARHDSLPTDTSLLEYEDVQLDTDLDADTFYSTLDIFADYKESSLSLSDTKIHLKDDDVVISINELYNAKETDIDNYNENETVIETLEPTKPKGEKSEKIESKLKRKLSPIRRKKNRRKDKRWKSDTEAMFREVNDVSPTPRAGSQRGGSQRVMDRYAASSEVMHLDVAEMKRVSPGEKKIRVPITVCLSLIFAYVIGGAFLFAQWEDWDILTGSYFCFVTLSTIGFGDIVPGTQLDAWESQEKLVACAMYLAMGLSVLAMCFNLMQEEVKEKCRWLARKIGIMSNDANS